jgi:SAM-dependent methyltransferase
LSTIDVWRGDFGDSYHERNRFDPEDVRPVFEKMLSGVKIGTLLEVGCGVGHNLAAIDADEKVGVEPNEYSRRWARREHPNINVIDGDAGDLPFQDAYFDLVLTCGLLIHISPAEIGGVVSEIARVSRRYVLLVEYAAVEEEMQEYRGVKDILWRRPFGKLFMAWEGMRLLRWDDSDSNLYPGCSWWLLEK